METTAPDPVSNINQGSGTQHNSTQGGHHNNQYNAKVQNFHRHDRAPHEGELPKTGMFALHYL